MSSSSLPVHLMSRLLLGLALALLAAPSSAQTGTLAGRVTDAATGDPLPGATVQLVGTSTGAAADAGGRFTIAAVPVDTHAVRVSLIGYEPVTQTVAVYEGERVVLDVALSEQTTSLGAISVVSRRGGFVPAELTSASKLGARPIETPHSVSVITQDQLEVQDATTLAEALRYTPGVQGEAWGFEPRFTWIKVRGFDATQTGLYRDGLQLRNVNYAVGYNVEPYSMERVEVLRGPASVLYGAGSPGGVVAFSSKRPTLVAQRELAVEAGSFGRLQAQADLSGPVPGAGSLSYRLTGLVRDSDTQVEFVENDRLFLAPALTWRPGANTSWTVLGHVQRDDTGASQALPVEGTLEANALGAVPTDFYTGAPGTDRYDRNEWSASSLFEHRVGETWTLRQNARFYRSDLDDVTVYSTGLLDDDRTLTRSVFGTLGSLDGLAVDNQALARFTAGAVETTLLGGLDLQRLDVGLRQTFGGAPSLDLFAPDYGQPVEEAPTFADTQTEQSQTGLYLQGQAKWADRLVLSLGGRYDWARTETANAMADGAVTAQDDRAFTGRAGVVYLSPIGVAPYASYAESFLPQVGLDADGQPFLPERGRQVEVGVKVQPSGVNGLVTVALFDLRRDDFLQFDPNTFLQVQTGGVRSRGVEVEAVASLLSGLDVTAGFAALDVEITESAVAAEVGERPTQIPDRTASLWTDYSVPRGRLAGLGLGAGVRHIGATWGDVPNTIETAATTLADMAVYYDLGRLRLSANVQNVFDDAYVASAFARSSTLVTFGAGRQVSVGLRAKF